MNKKNLATLIGITLLLAACSQATPGTPAITKPAQTSPAPSPAPTEASPLTTIELDYPVPLELITPENVTEIEHLYDLGQGFILGPALSYDEQTVAVQTANMIYLYDTETLDQIKTIDATVNFWFYQPKFEETKPVAFSPNGELLAYSIGKWVRLWDFSTDQVMEDSRFINDIPDWEPVAIEFSPSGERLLITTEGTSRECDGIGINYALYDLSGHLLFDQYYCKVLTDNYYRFTEDNKIYIFFSSIMNAQAPQELYVVDLDTGSLLESAIFEVEDWSVTLQVSTNPYSDAFFYDVSPDGQLLASLANKDGKFATRILDATSRRLLEITDGVIEFVEVEEGVTSWQQTTTPYSAINYYDGVCDFRDTDRSQVYFEKYIELTSTEDTALLIFTRFNQPLNLELWDIETCELIKNTNFAATKIPIFSPDGQWLAIGNGFDVNVFDIQTGKVHFTAKGEIHKAPLDLFTFNSDGTKLIASTYGRDFVSPGKPYPDYKLQIWDTVSGSLLQIIDPTTPFLKQVTPSPFSETILIEDSQISSIINLETGKIVEEIPIGWLAFGQDKSVWVSRYQTNGTIEQHDLTTGKLIKQLDTSQYYSVRHLVSNNSGNRLLAITRYEDRGQQFLTLFDSEKGKIIAETEIEFKKISGFVEVTQFVNDVIEISEWSNDYVEFWDFNLNQPLRNLPGNREVFSLLGDELLVTQINGQLEFWSFTTGDYLGNVQIHSRNSTITFSPDGRLIAITGKDGLVELWGVPKE